MATVEGRVVERFTKRPVTGATVNIGGNTGYTNQNGDFQIEAPAGRHDLSITANGYTPWFRSMAFNRAQNRIGVLTMDSDIRAQ